MRSLFIYRTRSEIECRRRIVIAIYAYAYEIKSVSLVDDHEYDRLAAEIDLAIPTARPDLDEWFKVNYDSNTGLWIHNHPELERVKELYESLFV